MNTYTVYLVENLNLEEGNSVDYFDNIKADKFDLVDTHYCFYDMNGNLVAMFKESCIIGVVKEED